MIGRLILSFVFSFTLLKAEMSLENKVGQLFFGFVYGEELDDSSREFLHNTRLGNIIYYRWANGLTSPVQVRDLSEQLTVFITTTTGVPPIIAVDQEGGRVCRLLDGFTPLPSYAAIGVTGNPATAYTIGRTIGKELASVGITMNLAPVVDVHTNPDNPVIGDRSFGSCPELVIAMAKQMIEGHRCEGIATVLKHFPGHGDTSVDSHLGLPIITKSLSELKVVELLPFKSLVDYADAIMTAHIIVEALDPDHPATFSKRILVDLLRHEWAYDGLIISDSLSMRAIVAEQSDIDEAGHALSAAAIEAFKAGCDCLIIGGLEWADFKPTQQQDLQLVQQVILAFRQAVLSGEIPMERVDASVGRILRRKGDVKRIWTGQSGHTGRTGHSGRTGHGHFGQRIHISPECPVRPVCPDCPVQIRFTSHTFPLISIASSHILLLTIV